MSKVFVNVQMVEEKLEFILRDDRRAIALMDTPDGLCSVGPRGVAHRRPLPPGLLRERIVGQLQRLEPLLAQIQAALQAE